MRVRVGINGMGRIGRELLRIANHFNYHLGQINYHRRLNS